MKHWLGIAFSAVACFGCGGGGGTPKPAATAVEATPARPDAADADQPTLTPVPAPDGLIAVGRVKSVAAVLDRLVSWTGTPIDWRQKLEAEEPGIAHALATDAPIEAAVSLPTRHRSTDFPAVISVGLKSLDVALDAARREGFSVSKLGAALYRVQGHEIDYCVVGAALGAAPARLVCGKDAAAVEALGPYALRGLPNESLPAADVHVELRAGPARRAYGGELRQLKMLVPLALHELKLDNARFDRAVADALHAMADELPLVVNDLDQISFDANLSDQTQALELTAKLSLMGRTSWVSKTIQEYGSHAGRPPEAFWKLPADSASGSYSTVSASKNTESMRQTLSEILAGYLESISVGAKQRDDLVKSLLAFTANDGTQVTASGPLPSKAKNKDKLGVAERARSILGWRIGVDTNKPDAYRAVCAALTNMVEDKSLRKRAAELARVDVALLPHIKSRAAAGLGAGATEYELTLSAKAVEAFTSTPGEAVSAYLVVAPLGTGTVLGVATAKDELYARIKKVRAGQGPLLSERQGLEGLKAMNSVSGGFVTIESVMSGETTHSDMQQLLSGLPHGGKTPVLVWSTVDASGAGPSTIVRMTVPKDVFSDAIAAALAHVLEGKQEVSGPKALKP